MGQVAPFQFEFPNLVDSAGLMQGLQTSYWIRTSHRVTGIHGLFNKVLCDMSSSRSNPG